VQWRNFEHNSVTYDLNHLHPQTIEFERPAKDGKPAVVYTVDLTYSLHCFSHKLPSGAFDKSLIYPNTRETRLFDFERYELSKRLPGIIETMAQRKCFHTGHGNFFTVEVVRGRGICRLSRLLHGLEINSEGTHKYIHPKRLCSRKKSRQIV
jgi:hypothetical protein